MWTLAFLLCIYSEGSCTPVMRAEVYKSEDACRSVAGEVTQRIYDESKKRGEKTVVLYKCLSWGEPA